ncbi:KH domain-containing protein HEN4 [Camellia lanceoleosa]|uniref:KH domain-containing protein HEN4 n=1 Tax=Camellia lanceoleosa TaxID=1840588 RepID=A0ACC0J3P7_9ERIC|nr:KH domain-containing protein HEN4 [Camellia lanceoleosa]
MQERGMEWPRQVFENEMQGGGNEDVLERDLGEGQMQRDGGYIHSDNETTDLEDFEDSEYDDGEEDDLFGRRSIMVTNTTVEIVVPENVIGSIYGENGSNLARLRQISGAKVIVHKPHPGATDRKVIISGTPDETQAAQSLLQAFILSGAS